MDGRMDGWTDGRTAGDWPVQPSKLRDASHGPKWKMELSRRRLQNASGLLEDEVLDPRARRGEAEGGGGGGIGAGAEAADGVVVLGPPGGGGESAGGEGVDVGGAESGEVVQGAS